MPRASGYPRSYYLAMVANLFFFASFQWTFATLASYVLAIEGGPAGIGLAYGLFTLSAVAVRPAMGRLIDGWGRKPVLLAGAGLFVLAPALYAMADSMGPFLVLRLVHGVGIAAFTTAYTALIADLAPPARRGEALGLGGMTSNLGLLFAPALGVAVQAKWGHAAHFWVAAAVAVPSVLLLLPIRESVVGHSQLFGEPPKAGSSVRGLARRRAVWTAALGGTGLAVVYGAVLSFLPPLAGERGLTAAGTYFTAFAVAMMVAQAAAGWLSDRIGRRAVVLPGLVVTVGAAAGLALARNDPGLIAAGAGLGASWGLVRAGLDTSVVDAVPAEARGTALGLLYTCFDIGVGAGSFGLAAVAQAQGYAAALGTAAGWALLALVTYALAGQRRAPAA